MGNQRCTKSNLTAATVDAIVGSTLMGSLTGVQSVARLGSAKVEHMQRRLGKGLDLAAHLRSLSELGPGPELVRLTSCAADGATAFLTAPPCNADQTVPSRALNAYTPAVPRPPARRAHAPWLTAIAAEGHIGCSDVVDSSGCSIERWLQRIRIDCSDVVAASNNCRQVVVVRDGP